MKLESDLRDAFMAAAGAADRPASQIMRELMRDFIRSQREADAYDGLLREKVELARASMRANCGRSSEAVEAEFFARRAALLRRADQTKM